MTVIEQPTIESLLKASELDYFRSGARVESCLGGIVMWIEGFQDLPCGCVLHNLSDKLDNREWENWLADVELRFSALHASATRFYFTAGNAQPIPAFINAGYQTAVEVGLAAEISHAAEVASDLLQDDEYIWQEVTGSEHRHHRKILYLSADTGPDGHTMNQSRFADFEQIKIDDGYMSSFLLYHHSTPVGIVSLSVSGGFARLKNLFVHSSYRRRGLGRRMVMLLMQEARNRGADYLGAYAKEGNPGFRTYRNCGMEIITCQIEYSKTRI